MKSKTRKLATATLVAATAVSLVAVSHTTPARADLFDPTITPWWCGGEGLPACPPTTTATLVKWGWATPSLTPVPPVIVPTATATVILPSDPSPSPSPTVTETPVIRTKTFLPSLFSLFNSIFGR